MAAWAVRGGLHTRPVARRARARAATAFGGSGSGSCSRAQGPRPHGPLLRAHKRRERVHVTADSGGGGNRNGGSWGGGDDGDAGSSLPWGAACLLMVRCLSRATNTTGPSSRIDNSTVLRSPDQLGPTQAGLLAAMLTRPTETESEPNGAPVTSVSLVVPVRSPIDPLSLVE